MSLEENKRIIRRWIDAGVNAGDLSVADELFETDVLAHAPEGDVRGVDQGPKASIKLLREAFPDLHFTVDDLIAEGDRVAARFEARGSHRGDFMGIAPTQKPVSFKGVYIYRLSSGRIAEVWISLDAMGLLGQLGATR
jgi:predicted ester cyclase